MNIEKMKDIEFFKNFDLQYAADSLTNVLSREMILSYLNYLLQKNIPFSLCLCDIDNFKQVNDNYGHMKGDEVLTIFAKKIEDSIGKKGIVGRYGGDEFMIILEEITEYNDVWEVFHKLNKEISKLEFENMDELCITLTSGISRYPIDGESYEDIISTADNALYSGNMNGRNCFIIYLAAKHANVILKTENESIYSSMHIHNKVFEILTNSNHNLKENIHDILLYFSTNYMYHNICIQNNEKILESIIHPLSSGKDFFVIEDKYFIDGLIDSNFMYVNHRRNILRNNQQLNNILKTQKIASIFIAKIEYNDKSYGYLRVDMCNSGRIWQNSEMDLLVTVSKIIGILLHYNNLTLEEIFDEKKQ